jgi:DNA-binding NarL/FixJ family response regulator
MARAKSKTITLYVVEEQEIYRELYKSALSFNVLKAPFELLGVSKNGDSTAVGRAISELKPDVLLFGTKKLHEGFIEELEQIRTAHPKMAIVLLLVSYNAEGIQCLRRIAMKGQGGMALFLKQSLDEVQQLSGIIVAAGHGQVILDPALAAFLFTEKTAYPFLGELTARESEILGLMSRGYTNASIAESLCIDVKTVEHHINSMYGKLKAESNFDSRHPRVSAARLYLEATGQLVPPGVLSAMPTAFECESVADSASHITYNS